MNVKADQWSIHPADYDGHSPVTVPHRRPTRSCAVDHPDNWVCTRPLSHGGRHAAALATGQVVAVWGTK